MTRSGQGAPAIKTLPCRAALEQSADRGNCGGRRYGLRQRRHAGERYGIAGRLIRLRLRLERALAPDRVIAHSGQSRKTVLRNKTAIPAVIVA